MITIITLKVFVLCGKCWRKNTNEKNNNGKNARFNIIADDSRMMYVTSGNHMTRLSSEWVITEPGQVKDLRKFNKP